MTYLMSWHISLKIRSFVWSALCSPFDCFSGGFALLPGKHPAFLLAYHVYGFLGSECGGSLKHATSLVPHWRNYYSKTSSNVNAWVLWII